MVLVFWTKLSITNFASFILASPFVPHELWGAAEGPIAWELPVGFGVAGNLFFFTHTLHLYFFPLYFAITEHLPLFFAFIFPFRTVAIFLLLLFQTTFFIFAPFNLIVHDFPWISTTFLVDNFTLPKADGFELYDITPVANDATSKIIINPFLTLKPPLLSCHKNTNNFFIFVIKNSFKINKQLSFCTKTLLLSLP